jgi:hypothetical protein
MAEWHHCWRCNKRVPMLDEAEWAQVEPLLRKFIVEIQRYRRQRRASLSEALTAVPTTEARNKVLELTGYYESDPTAIWHHRRASFGAPCSHCGSLLRTRRAKLCAECGGKAV